MSDFAQANYKFNGNQTVAIATHGDDTSVFAEFYTKPFFLEAESQKQGRPIYQDRPYLKITFPADKTKIWDQPVKMEDDINGPSDPHRFPRQWQAFINQQEQVPDGTALTEFPAFTKARVMELKSMNIHTVEQYAAVPDSANLGLGWQKERDICKGYLNKSAGLAQFTQLQAENERLKADMESLHQQMRELNSLAAVDSDDQPVRRGRPPKIQGV